MVLGFSTKILKDHLFHEPFHKIPVFNDAMSYRPLEQKEARCIPIVRNGKEQRLHSTSAEEAVQPNRIKAAWQEAHGESHFNDTL